jgi:heme A synthase
VFAQLAAGALNIVLLAPVSMQLVHLLLADLVWIALVVMVVRGARSQRAASTLVSTPSHYGK